MDVLWNLHGELERVLLLLKELSGQDWVDGCRWAIRYSVQNKNLRYDGSFFSTLNYDFILPFVYVHCIFRSSTIEMFKQLKDYYKNDAPERSDRLYFGSEKLVFNVKEVSFCFLMT
jgi:hypothetical protein